MKVLLLGTAAGGGFPQWNCWCPGCRLARAEPARAHPRTQSSIAVSADGGRWFLINASPDVREQIARIPRPRSATAIRDVPIEGVILTDAELDHSLGVLLLREARAMTLYATDAVAAVLERDSRILPTVRAFGTMIVTRLTLDARVAARDRDGADAGLTIEAFDVRGDAPRFASTEAIGLTVGLLVRDSAGAALAYVPGCGALDPQIVARLGAADAVLFDGTFWRDDEMVTLGISSSRAREMGHVPINDANGSLPLLAALPAPTRIYTHINNTNPILIEDSPERRAVEAAGLVVGFDGMMIDVRPGRTQSAVPVARGVPA
jgi:pyrroloquinoline quinone biosynthesis protein B